MRGKYKTIIIHLICFLAFTNVRAQLRLSYYPKNISRQELIQQGIDQVVHQVMGEVPLQLSDLRQQWVKPPYTQIHYGNINKGTEYICDRFRFDSLGRLSEHEAICAADSQISYLKYSGNQVTVNTFTRRSNPAETYAYYNFGEDGKISYIKRYGTNVHDTIFTRFFYNANGFIDSIYNGSDTIIFNYEAGYARDHYEYGERLSQHGHSRRMHPLADRHAKFIRVEATVRSFAQNKDRIHTESKTPSAEIAYNNHMVYSNGSKSYFIGRHKVFEHYHGPMYNPPIDGLADITLLHWWAPFGKLSYSSKNKHLTFSYSARNRYVLNTWHGKYIYKRLKFKKHHRIPVVLFEF